MRRKRGIGAKILAVVTAVSMFPAAGLTAMAAGTDGVTPPAALDIGHPMFKNTEQLDEVYNLGDVGYDSKQMMKDIYQQDLDNGETPLHGPDTGQIWGGKRRSQQKRKQ